MDWLDLLYTVAIAFISADSFKEIYEFFLFQGEMNTNRFRKRIYPKEYSFHKRFYLLTYFAPEIREKMKYRKQIKRIVAADYSYIILSVCLIAMQIINLAGCHFSGFLNAAVYIFWTVSIIFYVWFTAHAVRWSKWIKGELHFGEREFRIKLPDEKSD